MAVSGNYSTSNPYIIYWIEVITNSQSISNNRSNVTVKVHFKRTNTGYTTYGTGTCYCTINGTEYAAAVTLSHKITSSGIVLFSKSLNIPHNADGTKSLSVSAKIEHNAPLNSSYHGTSFTLNTIPRKSTITSISGNTIGSTVSVSISRASSNFTHNVYFIFGSINRLVGSGIGTSCSFTPPLSDAQQIPNNTSGTATIKVITYSGSTKLGEDTKTVTIKVPSSVVPTMTSLSATRVDGTVPSVWGIYVKTKSKATLTINGACGALGSTIKSYSISGGGFSSTTSSFTTGYLNTAGIITFIATITDSRGRTATKSCSINVVDYATPTIINIISQRCDYTGTTSDTGTYIKATATMTVAPCIGFNTIMKQIYYRQNGASTWIYAGSLSGSSGTTSSLLFGNNSISPDYTYEVLYRVTDTFITVDYIDTVSSSHYVMHFKNGGGGVAFGKAAEIENCLDVAVDWDLKVKGQILKEYIRDIFYPVGSIYMSTSPVNPGSFMGGTWVAWGNGRVPVGYNSSDSDFSTSEKTGGSKTITLSASQIPSHTHTLSHTHNINITSKGGGAHYHKALIWEDNEKPISLSTSGSGGSYVPNSYYTGYYNGSVYDKSIKTGGTPNHTHSVSGTSGGASTTTTSSSGSGGSHSNLQPYIVCYMWKRIG